MITLIGMNHNDAEPQKERFNGIVSDLSYDRIFVEGVSEKEWEKVTELNKMPVLNRMVDEFGWEQTDYDAFERYINSLRRGSEPTMVQEHPEIPEEDITFLDDPNSYEIVSHTLVEDFDEVVNEVNIRDEGINRYQLEQKIIEDKVEKEDFLDYFKRLAQEKVGYAALSGTERFEKMVTEVGNQEFSSDRIPDLGVILSFSPRIEFIREARKYVDEEDFQKLIADLRDDEIHDKRDASWHDQITNYLEDNPDDDVLVVCGLAHTVKADNTVRTLLEEEYSSQEVDIFPFDSRELYS